MGKLLMCRICLVENVRMCVVTDKSLQEMYEKLTDVPFVTEDRKPMLACSFCCTRLKQCCQLQRKCVEAEELLAQMLSEDYEEISLTNHGQLGFVGRLITTPVENISIGADCQIGSDAIKQELPAVCEEQDDVELQLTHLSEEVIPENLYNSHPDVETHHSESESEEEQLVMVFKIEEEEEHELSENLRVRETEKPELTNPDKRDPSVEDKPAHESESDPEDDALLMEMKTKAEEGQGVSKRKRRACGTRGLAVAEKPTLKRKLEDIIPAKQTMNVPSDSKMTQRSRTSTSESVAKNKESVTSISQSSYSQSSNLIQHNRIHISEKFFRCDICQRSFHNKGNLKKHIRKHSGKKLNKCDICQQSYSSESALKIHSRLHTGEKPYECDVCQRSFSQKSYLKTHSRLHTGEKPYKCDVCQRSFSQNSNLKLHKRQHTGEKPYKCDICQCSFSRKNYLKRHIMRHTSEKPYKCDVCQRSFRQKGYLKTHSRQHTGEKPYKCNICQRSFSQTSHLTKHKGLHTGEKPYKCDVCQRSFSRKSYLKVHILLHSGD